MPFIFLSYSHKDSEYANRLADSLEAKGLDVWIDERIDYGATWPQAIEENLDRCAAFVVVMTPDAKQSKWVQNELAYAMSVDKPIFPVHLAGRLWLTVAATQMVSVTGGGLPPASFYSRLASILAAGHEEAAPTTSVRERLRTELDELQRRYDNLTSRIRAVDTDLGREPDGERRQMLEERRAELAANREKTAGCMTEIEKQLVQIAEQKSAPAQVQEPRPARAEPVSSARSEAPPTTTTKVEPVHLKEEWPVLTVRGIGALLIRQMEEQPAPTVRMETPAPVKAVPVPPLAGDLLTIDKPIRLELIRIPAGEFLMGDDKHLVDVAEFYIGKYPVTNAQYAAFVQAKNYDRPKHWKDGRIPAGKENHPVVYVSWDDSVAFCEWLSQATGRTFRLPTEAEWEKAARGGLRIPGLDGALMDNPLPARTYPWGDKFSKDKCNVSESGAADTTPVDEYSPAGDSPYGVADMAGNVWEWVEDWYRLSRNYHVLRGGSWNDDQDDDASQFRSDTFRPMYLYDDRGFRVVAGLAPAS